MKHVKNIEMSNYYYSQNNSQKGPVTLEELKKLVQENEITADTFVWRQGFEDWEKAADVTEIRRLFASPPPVKKAIELNQSQPQITQQPLANITPQKKKRFRLVYLLIPLAIIGFFGIKKFNENQQKYNEQKSEYLAPSFYLRINNVNRKTNLLLEDVFTGTINNASKRTIYGEIAIRVKWYNKHDAFISEEVLILNKSVRPYGEIPFKIKCTSPLKAKKYHLEIKDATIISQY